MLRNRGPGHQWLEGRKEAQQMTAAEEPMHACLDKAVLERENTFGFFAITGGVFALGTQASFLIAGCT